MQIGGALTLLYPQRNSSLLYVSVNGFGGSTVLTVLFIYPDSRVLGERRQLLAMGKCLDGFEWPPWPKRQLAVYFLASLKLLTPVVKDGQVLWKLPVLYAWSYGHLISDRLYH